MNLNSSTKSLICLLSLATLAWPLALWSAEAASAAAAETETMSASSRAELQTMLEEAERARSEAEQARREATRVAERARETARRNADEQREVAMRERDLSQRERERLAEERARQRDAERAEMERAREELSRAHRELREASREIAQAHREMARAAAEAAGEPVIVDEVNLGDRAVLGVVLGREKPEGVELIGVSPDGPAERAGLKAGDLLLSIRGESLASNAGDPAHGRETVYRVMDEAKPGETLAVEVLRDGETWAYDVTAERREPSSWQTMIRITEAPAAPAVPATPGAPGAVVAPSAPAMVVERIEIPDVDMTALNERMQELSEQLKSHKFLYVGPDGEPIEWDGDWDGEVVLPDDFEVDIEGFSKLASAALVDADVWFGLPQAMGLELATINEGLGSYFKTDRGVLVIRAREDNAYGLRSGDVVLEIGDRTVNSPTDMMRALRETEPGQQVAIAIKRDRKDRTLKVTMPENRLGLVFPDHHEQH